MNQKKITQVKQQKKIIRDKRRRENYEEMDISSNEEINNNKNDKNNKNNKNNKTIYNNLIY